jgi:hypothetical protein
MQWTTHGHTGVDVNLYGYGKGLGDFVGVVINRHAFTFDPRIRVVILRTLTSGLLSSTIWGLIYRPSQTNY